MDSWAKLVVEDRKLTIVVATFKVAGFAQADYTIVIACGRVPDVLLEWIGPALQSPFFQAVLKGGTP